ncbi:MAG: DUF2300 domain-containing protein [Elusimicrobiota bacterium]
MAGCLAGVAAARPAAPEGALEAAFLGRGGEEYASFDEAGAVLEKGPLRESVESPLGSVWKLFVYLYLVDNRLSGSPYDCGGDHPGEVFCCRPGERVEMDEALVRSCGLYFDPVRLGVDPSAWRRYWRERHGLDHSWLLDVSALGPGLVVRVRDLLGALHRIGGSAEAMAEARPALARVFTEGGGKGAAKDLGGLLKIKTFTWDHPARKGALVGGFAGWLNDGTAVWVSGDGSSGEVIAKWGGVIARFADRERAGPSGQCVIVDFFGRYPIAEVLDLPGGGKAGPGPLDGSYRAVFKNGKSLDFKAKGELFLVQRGSEKAVVGDFDVNEYVARVLDREVETEVTEAARAFAILARTYLAQNAAEKDGCLHIGDSTRLQRVSVRFPSERARRLSRWTDSLVLKGVPAVRYHMTKDAKNLLSWRRAKRLAGDGFHYDEILRSAYPGGRIGVMERKGTRRCVRLAEAEAWLDGRRRAWRALLMSEPGFEEPEEVAVCKLTSGEPFADPERGRIFARAVRTVEDRLTVAHEYLHLAFRSHPNGGDERFIESTAKSLVLGERYGNGSF